MKIPSSVRHRATPTDFGGGGKLEDYEKASGSAEAALRGLGLINRRLLAADLVGDA